ncbi:hypothetical protein [Streptomyces sp. NPDC048361]|uniref:hypothetical protein n=1 Tax=Streptomyces sp. NPDC048361 TaxID=3154720 RepID=UPI00343F3477
MTAPFRDVGDAAFGADCSVPLIALMRKYGGRPLWGVNSKPLTMRRAARPVRFSVRFSGNPPAPLRGRTAQYRRLAGTRGGAPGLVGGG